jgi:hypothetical protein
MNLLLFFQSKESRLIKPIWPVLTPWLYVFPYFCLKYLWLNLIGQSLVCSKFHEDFFFDTLLNINMIFILFSKIKWNRKQTMIIYFNLAQELWTTSIFICGPYTSQKRDFVIAKRSSVWYCDTSRNKNEAAFSYGARKFKEAVACYKIADRIFWQKH